MSRRKQNSNAFDLMAFQDVITSTTGILLMFTFILILSIGVDKFMKRAEADQLVAIEKLQNLQLTVNAETELEQRQGLLAQISQEEALLRGFLAAEVAKLKAAEVAQLKAAEAAEVAKLKAAEPPIAHEGDVALPLRVRFPIDLKQPMIMHLRDSDVNIIAEGYQETTTLDAIDQAFVNQLLYRGYDGVVLLVEPSAYGNATLFHQIAAYHYKFATSNLGVSEDRYQSPVSLSLIPAESKILNFTSPR